MDGQVFPYFIVRYADVPIACDHRKDVPCMLVFSFFFYGRHET